MTANSALTLLGAASGEAGDHPRAVACFRESLELNAALEDLWVLIRTGQRLALLCGGAAGVLSPREREVLRQIAEGLSNKEIATRLSVAERTAKYHVISLFSKLGVSSRTQALAVARQRSLL